MKFLLYYLFFTKNIYIIKVIKKRVFFLRQNKINYYLSFILVPHEMEGSVCFLLFNVFYLSLLNNLKLKHYVFKSINYKFIEMIE